MTVTYTDPSSASGWIGRVQSAPVTSSNACRLGVVVLPRTTRHPVFVVNPSCGRCDSVSQNGLGERRLWSEEDYHKHARAPTHQWGRPEWHFEAIWPRSLSGRDSARSRSLPQPEPT
eukprot:1774953-Prymnesium_polylepis.1